MNFIFKNEVVDYNFFQANSPHTILFLHGWGGDKNSFTSTINLLKSQFNILSLTMPSIHPTFESWNLQDYCNLVETVLKIHNIKSTTIICHSFGFRVACILKNFIDIKSIIVTGGAGPKKHNNFKRIQTQNNIILLQNKRFKNLFLNLASKDYISLSTTNKTTFKNIVNCNTKNFLKFNCPMLLFWGKYDKDTKFWIAKKIRKQNNATLIKTKSDHFAYLKLNSLFNYHVANFLGKL